MPFARLYNASISFFLLKMSAFDCIKMLSHHENNVNILTTKYLALIILKIIDKMDDSVAYQAKNNLFVETLQPPSRAAAFIQLFSGFSLSALIEEIFKELLDEADDLSSLAFSAIIKNVLNKFKYFTH